MAPNDGTETIEFVNAGTVFRVNHCRTGYRGRYAYDSYLNPDIKHSFLQPPNLTRFLLYFNALESEEEQARLRGLIITQHRNAEPARNFQSYLAFFSEVPNLRLVNGRTVPMSVDRCDNSDCWHCQTGTGIYSFTHAGPWWCNSITHINGQRSPLIWDHTYQQYLDTCDNCFIGMLDPVYEPCNGCTNVHWAIKKLSDRERQRNCIDALPYIHDVSQFKHKCHSRREFAAQIAQQQARSAPELHN